MIPIKDNIPTDRFPFVTLALVVINFVVYYLAIRHGGSFFSGPDTQEVVRYGAIPFTLTHPGWHCAVVPVGAQAGIGCVHHSLPGTLPAWETIFTAMFMHASLLHIGGNMLFLWIFGNNIEDSMGRLKFIFFYLLGGLVASLAQFAIGMDSAVPTLGASGAIAAVLGGYALLYPRARVVTLIFIIFFITLIELPALLVLGAWFALQLFDASSQPLSGGGVAYFAHIGGFLFGLIAIKLFASRYDASYDSHNRLPVY